MNGKLRNMASIYIRKGNEMLMLYRIGSKVVRECFCGVGGHFEAPELNDAKAAILREMEEEIRLTEQDLDMLALRYIGLRNTKEELRLNYYFFAELKERAQLDMTCEEGILRWVPLERLMELDMPVTAKHCIRHYLAEGKNTNTLYAVTVLGDEATILPLPET